MEQITTKNRIYYKHTNSYLNVNREANDFFGTSFKMPKMTISLRQSEQDKSVYHYGVAICCDTDNFSKKIGRKLADERLENCFGEIRPTDHFGKDMTDHEKCLKLIYELTKSAFIRERKWREKVGKYNENFTGQEASKLKFAKV